MTGDVNVNVKWILMHWPSLWQLSILYSCPFQRFPIKCRLKIWLIKGKRDAWKVLDGEISSHWSISLLYRTLGASCKCNLTYTDFINQVSWFQFEPPPPRVVIFVLFLSGSTGIKSSCEPQGLPDGKLHPSICNPTPVIYLRNNYWYTVYYT